MPPDQRVCSRWSVGVTVRLAAVPYVMQSLEEEEDDDTHEGSEAVQRLHEVLTTAVFVKVQPVVVVITVCELALAAHADRLHGPR